jgi:hypothetical protein
MEYQLSELSLEKLFQRLSEAVALYRVSPTYLDFDASAFRSFQDFRQRTNASIGYQDIVHKDDPRVQMAMTRDLLVGGKLIVPDTSLIWAELDRLDREDVEDNSFVERFPLACCFASVIAGFRAHPPIEPIRWSDGPSQFSGVPGGWMSQ